MNMVRGFAAAYPKNRLDCSSEKISVVRINERVGSKDISGGPTNCACALEDIPRTPKRLRANYLTAFGRKFIGIKPLKIKC